MQYTGYDGQSENISDYDSIGNPCKYRGHVLKWERGRQLAKYGEIEYRYDASGIRQEKQIGNVLHKYYTDGSRIYKEERGNEVLWYHYDNTGVTGLEHNGKKYYFQKNIQGDVVRIFDEAGSLKASYIYDAWGNHRVIDGMTGMDVTHDFTIGGVTTDVSQHIGNINPFRYRGYYFDCETGLYYLNSRYYDPAICRFINADDVAYLQPETLNGNNLYAYCGNNPVMYTDPTGKLFWFFFGAILIGAAIGGTMNGISAYNAGQRGWGLFGAIAGGAVMGGAMGGVLALGGAVGLASIGLMGFGMTTGTAFGISLGIGAGAGIISYSLENGLRTDRVWTVGGMFKAGFAGAIKGIATYFIGRWGGKNGAYDKLALKSLLGKEFVRDCFSYGIAKGLLSAAMPGFWRSVFTLTSFYLGDTITKMLLVSSLASGARWLIDQIFG